jgi:uncharacterized RDD family membrane protein YckC
VFCPACGVRNEPGVLQCFVCKKSLPSSLEPSDRSRPHVIRTAAAQVDQFGSIGDRMLALVFDRVLLATLLVIPATLLADRWADIEKRLPSVMWSVTAIAVAMILLVFLYHTFLEGATGTTLGKAIFGLRVQNESERGRFAAAVIRNALRIVDSIGFYALGFLIAVFSPRKQRLGDHIAGTVVLERRLHPGLRATFIFIWLVLVAGSLWFALNICPDCVFAPYQLRRPW